MLLTRFVSRACSNGRNLDTFVLPLQNRLRSERKGRGSRCLFGESVDLPRTPLFLQFRVYLTRCNGGKEYMAYVCPY